MLSYSVKFTDIHALRIINRASAFLGAVFFVVMLAAVSLQVFSRFVLGRQFGWTFEISVYAYIFVTFLGAGIAAEKGSHVAFDMLHSKLSPRRRIIADLAGNIFFIAIILVLAPSVYSYIKFAGPLSSASVGMPLRWLLYSFPIGMGLILINLIARCAALFKELFGSSGGRCL